VFGNIRKARCQYLNHEREQQRNRDEHAPGHQLRQRMNSLTGEDMLPAGLETRDRHGLCSCQLSDSPDARRPPVAQRLVSIS
jgi:hypothetical protein